MTSSDSFSEEKLENSDSIKRLYRNVADLARRLDCILKQASCWEDLFTTDVNILRTRLKECCERLMFYEAVSHGKKAEDLLWRKVYYDVVVAAKKLRTANGASNAGELALENHLTTGTGTYHHLMFRIQSEFGLNDGAADFLHLSDKLASRNVEKGRGHSSAKGSVDSKIRDWAVNAFQRCLICLGDLARYRQDLFGNSCAELSERYYAQAAFFHPANGMPHNQQGTLSGTSHFGCDAAYHYMRCLVSQQAFEGSEGNLERVFDRAQKLLLHSAMEFGHADGSLKTEYKEMAIKRYLTRFMTFCSICFFEKQEHSSIRLEQLCEQVLQDLYDCMQFPLQDGLDNSNFELDGVLVFRMVVMALMCVHHLISQERTHQSAAIAFTLALFSHLLQHLVTKLQRLLGPPAKTDCLADSTNFTPAVNACRPNGDSPEVISSVPLEPSSDLKKRDHLNRMLKRRRKKLNYCLSLEDSDLSEGEHSEDGVSDSDEANQASDISEEGTGGEGEASTSEEELVTESNGHNALHSQQNHTSISEGINGQLGTESHPKLIKEIKLINHAKNDGKVRPRNKLPKNFHKGKFSRRHVPSTPRQVLAAVEGEMLLGAVKICTDWLRCHPNIFTACAQGSQLLWSRLATLLNMVTPVLHIEYKEGGCSELVKCLEACIRGATWEQQWPLPEDSALRDFPLLREAQEELQFSTTHSLWLSPAEKALFRIACLHQFGLLLTRYSETNLTYNEELHLFKKSGEQEVMNGMTWPVTDKEHKEAVEFQRKQLMKNMAHLRLQAEVTELESTVNLSNLPSLSPYVVVTTAVLVDHLAVLRLLLFSKRFIVVIPSCVVQHLDLLKKESLQARDVIRWLEAEFHRGNRYLRAQKQHEHISLSPMKYPKRKEKDVWDFFQILECCNHLVQQGTSNNGSSNNSSSSSMVTLLIGETDQKGQEAERGAWNFEAIVQSTGVKMENIESFLVRWQDSSKNQR